MLSPDGELRKEGGKTGIKWFEDFLAYKRILVVKTKKMQKLFQFFDEGVFNYQDNY